MSTLQAITWRAAARTIAGASLALALASMAQAQVTDAQKNAMRSSCRSDYMANCMSVPPGGKEAFECLKSHMAKLSTACRDAVSAVTPPTAGAPAPTPKPAAPKPAEAAPAPPTAPSPPKAAAVPPTPPATKPAAAAPPPAPSSKTTAAPASRPAPTSKASEQQALREFCRNDFTAHCHGVRPGTREALVCLQRNVRRLSPGCAKVVRSTMPSPPATVARPAPMAPPVQLAPAPPPKQTPRPSAVSAAVMFRDCKLDLIRHCRAVPAGEGRKLECLLDHASALSLRCRTALKVTSPLR